LVGHPEVGRGALPNAPYISTTKGLRARAIIAVLLACALRPSAVAALTDGRYSGGFTPEATGDARCANAPDAAGSACDFRPRLFARLAGSRRGGAWRVVSGRPSAARRAKAG